MPAFDFRHVQVAKYVNTSGVISYDTPVKAGDAINAQLELRFAEGRLYAEGALAEYLKEATGGTISLGVKYIPAAAQQLMYGATAKTRSIGSGASAKTISGAVFSGNDAPKYVGVSFYAPDMIDGVRKFTCVFISKTLFGPPSLSYQTKGENIVFQTPTTTGEFLVDDSSGKLLLETATCDTMEDAIAWCNLVLGVSGT